MFGRRRPATDPAGTAPIVDETTEPVFIVGWYRTGTTFLHNLLDADPANRAPKTWELMSPTPSDRDPVRDARLRRLRSGSVMWLEKPIFPELAIAHEVSIDEPEECFFLLENDFVSGRVLELDGGQRI